MGLMDRDYYREKGSTESKPQELFRKLKENPFAIIILGLIILFVIGMIL